MALIYNSEKFDSSLNTYRETFGNIDNISTTENNEQQYDASIIIPLDFSLEMDGISGIIPNSAFEIPTNILPKMYLTKKGESRIAFILHTVDHNFNNNKWTTKITGQTLHIRFDELSDEEKLTRKKQQESLNKIITDTLRSTPYTLTSTVEQNVQPFIFKGTTTSNQDKYMIMTYKGLLAAGFNSNQAKFLVAEIGRENSYNPNILFAFHNDPASGYNAGMLSWQKTRKTKLISDLKKQGLSLGKIPETEQEQQRLITAMARYIIWEMRNDPLYKRTKKQFLENPNVTNETAIEVLGNNYILWRLTDPDYRAEGLKNRAIFLNRINKFFP